MDILMIGGSGFMGRSIALELLENGHSVTAFHPVTRLF